MANALKMLKDDHATVDALFEQFEHAGSKSKKKSVVKKIVKELSIHAAIEEQVFYPAVREAIADAEDEVLEALEEHHVVKWILSEIARLEPEDERFDAKVRVLIENVRHHVKEEERELFKTVRKHLSREQLAELGRALAAAKRVAPTRPHPRAPDTPPGNLIAGVGAGLLDRARDAIMGARTERASARAATSARTKRGAASARTKRGAASARTQRGAASAGPKRTKRTGRATARPTRRAARAARS